MICPKCQFDNPEPNRFCGMCGSRLQEATADQARPAVPGNGSKSPENGSSKNSSVRRPFIVSTTAMADATAQMLNTRVVLPTPSVASSTHSGYIAPLRSRVDDIAHGEDLPVREPAPVDPHDEPMFANGTTVPAEEPTGFVHELNLQGQTLQAPEEREADEWLDRTVAEHEAHMPPPPPTHLSSSGSILGLNTAPPVEHSYAVEEEPVSPARNEFIRFDESKSEPRRENFRDVSGPSFLGLGTQDYLMEEQEPHSHTRRNVLLLVLIIIAVLGFLEWRATSRGESANPMEVLHLKIPKKKGQGQVEVMQGSANNSGPNATTDNSASTSASNNAKPDLIAEPNQAATQNGSQGTPNATSSANTTATDSGNSAATNSETNAAPPPNATASSQTPSAPPEAAKPVTTANSQPPSAAKPAPAKPSSKPAATEVAKATPPRGAKPSSIPQSDASASTPAASEADASLYAGGFELQRGKAAGATEEGRMWLWKAVAKGNGEAPVLLADMYLQGTGVSKDCEQAVLLLNAAAKKSNPRARSKLGSMYATGQCVAQDRVQAYKWMTSALQANPGSEWIEKNRQSLLSEMTPGERQRAAAIR